MKFFIHAIVIGSFLTFGIQANSQSNLNSCKSGEQPGISLDSLSIDQTESVGSTLFNASFFPWQVKTVCADYNISLSKSIQSLSMIEYGDSIDIQSRAEPLFNEFLSVLSDAKNIDCDANGATTSAKKSVTVSKLESIMDQLNVIFEEVLVINGDSSWRSAKIKWFEVSVSNLHWTVDGIRGNEIYDVLPSSLSNPSNYSKLSAEYSAANLISNLEDLKNSTWALASIASESFKYSGCSSSTQNPFWELTIKENDLLDSQVLNSFPGMDETTVKQMEQMTASGLPHYTHNNILPKVYNGSLLFVHSFMGEFANYLECKSLGLFQEQLICRVLRFDSRWFDGNIDQEMIDDMEEDYSKNGPDSYMLFQKR